MHRSPLGWPLLWLQDAYKGLKWTLSYRTLVLPSFHHLVLFFGFLGLRGSLPTLLASIYFHFCCVLQPFFLS